MWSVIQQRRLRRQAESQRNDSQTEKGGRTSSGQATDGDAEKPGQFNSQDNKIWVKTTGDDDPIDPRNWPLLDRSKNIAILAYLIFVQAWAGAAESMANSAASQEQGHSKVAENLTIAMYLFGIGNHECNCAPAAYGPWFLRNDKQLHIGIYI